MISYFTSNFASITQQASVYIVCRSRSAGCKRVEDKEKTDLLLDTANLMSRVHKAQAKALYVIISDLEHKAHIRFIHVLKNALVHKTLNRISKKAIKFLDERTGMRPTTLLSGKKLLKSLCDFRLNSQVMEEKLFEITGKTIPPQSTDLHYLKTLMLKIEGDPTGLIKTLKEFKKVREEMHTQLLSVRKLHRVLSVYIEKSEVLILSVDNLIKDLSMLELVAKIFADKWNVEAPLQSFLPPLSCRYQTSSASKQDVYTSIVCQVRKYAQTLYLKGVEETYRQDVLSTKSKLYQLEYLTENIRLVFIQLQIINIVNHIINTVADEEIFLLPSFKEILSDVSRITSPQFKSHTIIYINKISTTLHDFLTLKKVSMRLHDTFCCIKKVLKVPLDELLLSYPDIKGALSISMLSSRTIIQIQNYEKNLKSILVHAESGISELETRESKLNEMVSKCSVITTIKLLQKEIEYLQLLASQFKHLCCLVQEIDRSKKRSIASESKGVETGKVFTEAGRQRGLRSHDQIEAISRYFQKKVGRGLKRDRQVTKY